MHENFPAGGIITDGLGMDACKGLAITTKFNLWCGVEITVPPNLGAGHFGGGSKPLAPGEIKSFYKVLPKEQQPYYLTPLDYDPFVKTQHVLIKLNFGEKEIERDYVVSDRHARAIIKAMNIINATQSKIAVGVENLKKLAVRASAIIKNLRKKK